MDPITGLDTASPVTVRCMDTGRVTLTDWTASAAGISGKDEKGARRFFPYVTVSYIEGS